MVFVVTLVVIGVASSHIDLYNALIGDWVHW